MDKQKAIRLDAILKALNMKSFLGKAGIETKTGIKIEYPDLHTIYSMKYNNKGIVQMSIQSGHRLYKLTADGSAFRTDVGFVNLQKTETSEKRTKNINLIIAVFSIVIAVASFVFSIFQSNSQYSQYERLEQRVELLENSN